MHCWPRSGLAIANRPSDAGDTDRDRLVFSLVAHGVGDKRKHAREVSNLAQVFINAEAFGQLDATGELAPLFSGAPFLSRDQRRLIATEESWILGPGHENGLRWSLPSSWQTGAGWNSARWRTNGSDPPLASIPDFARFINLRCARIPGKQFSVGRYPRGNRSSHQHCSGRGDLTGPADASIRLPRTVTLGDTIAAIQSAQLTPRQKAIPPPRQRLKLRVNRQSSHQLREASPLHYCCTTNFALLDICVREMATQQVVRSGAPIVSLNRREAPPLQQRLFRPVTV